MCDDGRALGGGVVWHCGGIDGRLGKVDALVHPLKMDQWEKVVMTYESA